jgi:hypothetical protein
MKVKTIIIGAGIGGLAAGAFLKQNGDEDFLIIEKQPYVPNNLSNGLHYLHDIDFPLPFKMDFKKCLLTESIWDARANTFKEKATLPEAFEYSKKVMDNLRHPSSILDPGKRDCVWIPESNDMNELIKKYEEYIGTDKFMLNANVLSIDEQDKTIKASNTEDGALIEYEHIISTAPAPLMHNMLGNHNDMSAYYKKKPLYITNYKTTNIVPNWMIVLYVSDPKFPPYRISCFNNVISMESMVKLGTADEVIIQYLIGGLFEYELDTVSSYVWETGRIFGRNKIERKGMVDMLTNKDIWPIGRFGLWNGKLRMDDTIEQAQRVVGTLVMGEHSKGKFTRQNVIESLYE